MANINESGRLLAFASGMIRFCIVIVAVGPMCHKTAAQPVAVNVTNSAAIAAHTLLWYNDFVYFADGTTLVRYDPNSQSLLVVKLQADAVVNFLVPVSPDEINNNITLAIGFGNGVGLFTWENFDESTVLVPYNHLTVITELNGNVKCGKADVYGRLWVGTSYTVDQPDLHSVGRIYMVDTNGTVTMQLDNLGIIGDISWSPDFDWLYYTDIYDLKVFGHSVDKNFVLSKDPKVIFDFAAKKVKGLPYGMTVDYSGNLWVACSLTSHFVKIDPNTGNLLMTVDLPEVYSVTSLTFGSPSLLDMYVITNVDPTKPSEKPNSGDLFLVTNTTGTGIYVIEINVSWPKEKPPE